MTVCLLGDNWKEARKLNVSTQHILIPMHVNIELSKAMVFMDIKMPKYVFCYPFHILVDFLSKAVKKEMLYLIDFPTWYAYYTICH